MAAPTEITGYGRIAYIVGTRIARPLGVRGHFLTPSISSHSFHFMNHPVIFLISALKSRRNSVTRTGRNEIRNQKFFCF